MANNRMYLVNARTGARVYLAKYYPSTGWYCVEPETLAQRLDAAFHDRPGEMWGDEWALEYETTTEEEAPS